MIEVIVLLFIISYFFGKYTGKKIEKLLTVTKKIKEQDLDFIIDSSGIFEIDQALNALDDMKIALKNSLDGLYDTIVGLEERIEDAKLRRSSIEMEQPYLWQPR